MASSKWLRAGTLAALDQAWLSAVNFGVSVAFIRGAEKTEYGFYLLLLTPIYLIQGIQNALFLSPFTTIFPAKPSNLQKNVFQTLVWGQVVFTVAFAALGFLGLTVYQKLKTGSVELAVCSAFALAIAGMIAREAMRSAQYVRGHAGEALLGDLIFGMLLLGAIAFAFVTERLDACWTLMATGVAGLTPLIVFALRGRYVPLLISKASWLEFWRCGRWALTGVGLTWINLNAYPYFAAIAFGATGVAEINAARLFMMPVALCLPAWSNLVRPRFSRWYAEKQRDRMRSVSAKSMVVGCLGVVCYGGILFGAYPYLEHYLGSAYQGLLPLILAWVIFFLFTVLRNILMVSLMVKETGYRQLTKISVLGLLLIAPAMWGAMQISVIWIVASLALIELVQVVVVGRFAVPYWRETRS